MSRTSVFPAGLRLEGTIEGEGDLIIAGTVTGPVTVVGSLWIERGGRVEGEVQASSVVVRGVLVGNADAKDSIRLEPSAVVVGDASAPRVSVQEGAKIRGRVRMSGEPLVPKAVRRRRKRGTRPATESPADAEAAPASDADGSRASTSQDSRARASRGRSSRAPTSNAPASSAPASSAPASSAPTSSASTSSAPASSARDRSSSERDSVATSRSDDRPRPRRKKRRRARRPPPPTIPVVQRQKARRKDHPRDPVPT